MFWGQHFPLIWNALQENFFLIAEIILSKTVIFKPVLKLQLFFLQTTPYVDLRCRKQTETGRFAWSLKGDGLRRHPLMASLLLSLSHLLRSLNSCLTNHSSSWLSNMSRVIDSQWLPNQFPGVMQVRATLGEVVAWARWRDLVVTK